jgi:predicted P-loop ATPase
MITKEEMGGILDSEKISYILPWAPQMDRKADKSIIENIPNIKIILARDPRWLGVFKYNEMARRVFVHKNLPWDHAGGEIDQPWPLEDYDLERVQAWMQKQGGMSMVRLDFVAAAVKQVARDNSYNPVQEQLKGLVWDGEKRLDTWLVDYCGAPDIPYTRAIGRMFLVATVKRVMEPGCKMDYMLILEGKQGIGKSTICQILGGEKFTGVAQFNDLSSTDTSLFLKNKWIIEFGEMHALRKAEVNELKLWLVKQEEDYRPKYGRENVVEPRQCVFIGTSNGGEYLRDPTGGRRFWPVWCNYVKRDEFRLARDQVMAEAVAAYRAGEDIYPSEDFEKEHFAPQQESRQYGDPWEEYIRPMLAKHNKLTLDAICMALRIDRAKIDHMSNARIRDILIKEGWEYKRSNSGRFWQKSGTVLPTKAEAETLAKANLEAERLAAERGELEE